MTLDDFIEVKSRKSKKQQQQEQPQAAAWTKILPIVCNGRTG